MRSGACSTRPQRYCPEAMLIYTSDHGDHLGAFGLCAKGPTMYDHMVAVPLVVAGPRLPAGNPLDCLTSSLDVWPTVLEAAGIHREAGVDAVGKLIEDSTAFWQHKYMQIKPDGPRATRKLNAFGLLPVLVRRHSTLPYGADLRFL